MNRAFFVSERIVEVRMLHAQTPSLSRIAAQQDFRPTKKERAVGAARSGF
jgi:hypothetical protein